MKKFWKSLMFAVVGAFVLNSCDDVPAPYPMPISEGDDPAVIVDPAGDGTLDTPYNVAAVRQLCGELEQTTDNTDKKLSPEIYVKGIVSKVETDGKNAWSSQYGNITYYISDDGKTANEFEVYRGLGLDGAKFASQNGVNVGDEVIICGKVLNFKGTYEFDQGSKLVSLNGQSSGGDTPVSGIEVTCAQAVELTNALADGATSEEIYTITGYITEVVGSVSRDQQIFWMADTKDGGKVFEAYWANLPSGVTEFVKGSKVKITGNLMKYVKDGNVTPEIKNATVEILEAGEGGGGGDTPPGDLTGDGTKDKPYTATDVFTVYNGGQTPTGVWIKGFIVGYVEGQKLAEGAHFNAEGNVVASNILLAASADETDYNNCIAVQLPVGDVRTRINLKDHAENLKAEVSLYGDIAKYFGVAGLKNTSKYIIGTETNDNGDNGGNGGETGDSSVEQVFTSGQGSWSIADVELDGLSYVWQQNAQYGMKASAFSNNSAKATESWLISPAFTVGEKKTLSFNNCLNYLKGATLTDHIAVMVSTNYSTGLPSTATWTSLDFAPKPDGSSWNWVDSKVDLSAYANQSIRIAFKYVSNTTTAPTWEVKSVTLE